MSRLAETFERLRREQRPGLVTYVTAGDPDLARTEAILHALDRGGADVVEVGVPFSDPLADGPVIQRATERALASGTTLTGVLELIGRVRGELRMPVVVFSYANPVLRLGPERFADAARDAGVDGVLVLDLPIEEAGPFRQILADGGLIQSSCSARRPPTTVCARPHPSEAVSVCHFPARCDRRTRGSRRGRGRDGPADSCRQHLPIALGFGISKPEHVREVGRWADAAVVGSALVTVIAEAGASSDLDDPRGGVCALAEVLTSKNCGAGST
jgi:tryptophan synthase alpha chain